MKKDIVRKKIFDLIKSYYSAEKEEFVPGKSLVRYAGSVYDEKEVIAMVDSLLSGWLGLGKQGELFEKEFAQYVGTKHSLLVNSGSSANLLGITALMSWRFPNRLEEGDEIIVAASAFPSTINPIIQNRLIPVFIDVDPQTYNLRVDDLPKALSKKTRLIVVCHNLGNPNEMDKIMEFANKHNLFVFEDNCDALGSTYEGKKTGSFGILASESFYPAHHMTTAGEGGAVLVKDDFRLYRIVQSLRDWGRSCWCGASGGPKNGVCGYRFKFKIDGFPYDHKYIFDHIGYNLKPTEAQAAMGREQLKKLPDFIAARKQNFKIYENYFKKYQQFFILPKALPKADPSWFSFLLTIKEDAPFDRFSLTNFLEDNNIQTRPSFSGNVLRQPAYRKSPFPYRVVDSLANSDRILERAFFIGIYPGLTDKHLDYAMSTFDKFLSRY